MAITYPITLPVSPSEYTVNNMTITSMTTSIFTGEQYVYSHQGQWWEISMKFGIGDKNIRGGLVAALTSLQGKYGTFYFEPKGGEAISRGIPAGSPVVDGNSQLGNDLATTGWTSNLTGALKAGDWIQVGVYSETTTPRLYRVLSDVDTDESGNANITVFPRIRVGTLTGDSIIYTNPKGIFRMVGDFSYTFSPGSIYKEINLTAREVL